MKNIFIRQKTFYFRKNIPFYLQIFFNNQTRFIRSLQTKSKTKAFKYVILLNKKFEAIKEVYKMNFDIEVVKQLVYEFHNLILEELEDKLRSVPNPEDLPFCLGLEDEIKQLQINLNKNIFQDEEIKEIKKKLNFIPDQNQEDEIGRVLLKSKIEHLKNIYQNIENKVYKKPKQIQTLQKEVKVKEVEIKNVAATINNVKNDFFNYQEKEDNWSKDTKQLAERTFNILELFFKETNLRDIKFPDLIAFRDTMQEIPDRLTTLNEFKNKDLNYILENCEDYKNLSNSTINKYILKTNQFLKWSYKMDYIDKQDFTIPKLPNDTKSRLPYTDQEIQKIKELVNKDENKDINYITLVAMYQGMRLKEITQLKKEDIINLNNVFCININQNENKTTKTKKSIRTIPIHPKLIELGFLDFVNSKQDNLFNINNKDFSSYYRLNYKNLINESKPFYSLRHSFIDTLYQNNQKLEHIQAFVGHTQGKSITFNYTTSLNTNLLNNLLKFINY